MDTLENNDDRRALFTGPNIQLVLMTLQPGDSEVTRAVTPIEGTATPAVGRPGS